jgi:hypothetical protein
VVVATRAEYTGLPIPSDFAPVLAGLAPGQGFIGESVRGEGRDARRWLIVSGADEAGLEKALLTLGSGPALESAPPNPSVLDSVPPLSEETENLTRPGPGEVTFRRLGSGVVSMRGLYESEASVSGWRLPPGYQLGSDSRVTLHVDHSRSLRPEGTWLDVLVNGEAIGRWKPGGETGRLNAVTFDLPAGLKGRDPMVLGFRAHLDVGPVSCEDEVEELAWLNLGGHSTLEFSAVPVAAGGLGAIEEALLRDAFMRKAAILLPWEPSLRDIRLLFDLSLHLGARLPSSPVLWPEALRFSSVNLPVGHRVEGRSVMVLGPVRVWEDAVSGRVPVLVDGTSENPEAVRIQGRRHRLDEFEPTVALVNMRPSPWSPGAEMILAGGWRDLGGESLRRWLFEPEVRSRIHGDLAAVDIEGRVALYDLGEFNEESFAERLKRMIPAGLSAAETRHFLAQEEARMEDSRKTNWMLALAFGSLLILLLGLRVWFMWRRVRLRNLREGRGTQGEVMT